MCMLTIIITISISMMHVFSRDIGLAFAAAMQSPSRMKTGVRSTLRHRSE